MGKVYSTPKELGNVPEFNASEDYGIYEKAVEEFVAKVQAWAKENGSGVYAGKEIDFPVADGYARYIVLSLNPVQLVHLPVGDAWQFQYVHRLTAKDIREKLEAAKSFQKMFRKQP